MRAILSSGVASARKSSTPASSAMAAAVSGLSPVIITVRMPMARSSAKRSRMPGFTTSLRWMTPEDLGVRRPPPAACRPGWRCSSTIGVELGRAPCRPASSTQRLTESAAPLRTWRPSKSMPAHAGLGGERARARRRAGPRARGRSCSSASATMERPSGVSSASDESRAASASSALGDAGHGEERGGLAVAEGDGAGLVEQQGVDSRRPPRRPGRTWRARCAAPGGPCRRCRWPRAAPRWWSGSGRPAGRPARRSTARRCE